ncbi:MAG: YceI family protein [Rhizomicrobium sp.]
MKSFASAALCLLLATQTGLAAPWKVDYPKSRLGFTVQWSNEPFSGSFRRWNAQIDFDPNDLAHSRATVMVDRGSEFSDEPDFDSGLKGAQGFQTSQFPAARFATSRIVRTAADSYIADGTLTIHGISRAVTLPFKLSIAGGVAHMIGTAHMLRTDFGIGQGEWAASSPVAHVVAVNVDLTATR